MANLEIGLICCGVFALLFGVILGTNDFPILGGWLMLGGFVSMLLPFIWAK